MEVTAWLGIAEGGGGGVGVGDGDVAPTGWMVARHVPAIPAAPSAKRPVNEERRARVRPCGPTSARSGSCCNGDRAGTIPWLPPTRVRRHAARHKAVAVSSPFRYSRQDRPALQPAPQETGIQSRLWLRVSRASWLGVPFG